MTHISTGWQEAQVSVKHSATLQQEHSKRGNSCMGFYERIGVFVGLPEGCVMFVRPIFAVSFFAVGGWWLRRRFTGWFGWNLFDRSMPGSPETLGLSVAKLAGTSEKTMVWSQECRENAMWMLLKYECCFKTRNTHGILGNLRSYNSGFYLT